MTSNAGRKPPENMPPDIAERMREAEARLDVVMDEIGELEKLLKAFTDEEQKKCDANVLKGGPKGSGQIQDGILVEVDGQTVEPDKNGVLRIKDSRSRYNGLKTADYFEKVVKPWGKANAKLLRKHERRITNGEIDPKTAKRPRAPWPPIPDEYLKEKAHG